MMYRAQMSWICFKGSTEIVARPIPVSPCIQAQEPVGKQCSPMLGGKLCESMEVYDHCLCFSRGLS